MKVLVCGARGFIGGAVCNALSNAGHEVIAGVRQVTLAQEHGGKQRKVDFVNGLKPEDWGAALDGVDAVVNAVGILRDTLRAPMRHIHALAPIALYEACAQEGIRRVIHLSALGIAQSATPYAQTKRIAEDALLRMNEADKLDAVILRPSIVFGRGGQSSALFMGLASLPLQVLPIEARQTMVQPISVQDVADTTASLLKPDATGEIHCGGMDICGPEALTLAEFINLLRTQQGQKQARQYFLPSILGRWSAALADIVPLTPWGRQALELLSRDNTGEHSLM